MRILSLPNHERGLLFIDFGLEISPGSALQFSVYWSCPSFVKLDSEYFVFYAIANGIESMFKLFIVSIQK